MCRFAVSQFFRVVSDIDGEVRATIKIVAVPSKKDGGPVWLGHHFVEGNGATTRSPTQRSYLTEIEALDAARLEAARRYQRCRLERLDRAVVLLAQWGDRGEREELEQALQKVDYTLAEQGRDHLFPDVLRYREDDSSPDIFLRNLERKLIENPDIQVAYVSAHGNRLGQLSCLPDTGDFCHYRDLGRALRNGLATHGVSLVLGMCEALCDNSALLNELPSNVSRVYGFTGKPCGYDVAAVIAAVLLDDVSAFEKLSMALREGMLEEVTLAEAPARDVRSGDGGELVIWRRDGQGNWECESRIQVPVVK